MKSFKQYNTLVNTPIKTDEFVITIVGDIMQHPDQLRYETENNFLYECFSNVKELLIGDVVIGNLETTFSGYVKAPKDRVGIFCSPDDLAVVLKQVGFTHISLNNNHMFDYESGGFERTKKIIKSSGMIPLTGSNVFDNNGTSIELTTFTTHLNADEKNVGTNISKILMYNDIMKDYSKIEDTGADIKIMYPHWGAQYNLEPNAKQKTLGHLFQKSGYNVVGSGPHSIHETFCDFKSPLLSYSLGDFLSAHQKPGSSDVGKILTLKFKNKVLHSYIEHTTFTETIGGKSIIKVENTKEIFRP